MARQMKDSGVEWMGEIPEEWRVGRIKDFAQLQTGATPSTSCPHYFNGEIPWFTPGDFSESFEVTVSQRTLSKQAEDEKQAVILPPQTPLLVGIGASAGKVSFSQVKCSCNQQVTALIECSANPKLLTYILEAGRVYLRDTAAFTTLPIINNQTLGYFKIAVPTCVAEQQEIAAILDSKCADIDKVIEQTCATIEEYKKLKQAIITEAVTKGVRGSRPMKPSGVEWIGNIPEEWKISRIKDLGKCSNGISKSGEYFGSGSPFVTYKDVYDNFSIISPTGLIESNTEEQSTYSVEKDDVFFTRTSETIEEIGFSSVCCQTIPNATFAGFIIRFRPQKGLLYCGYTKYYFRSNIHRSYFNKEMNIVTRASLSQTLLKKLSVLLPQYKEQQEIAAYLDTKCAEIDRIIQKKEQLIEELGSYKKSLIYEYVTGKKEVSHK